MPNEQIGLIIWGCKGGHRVFCSNDVVDHREPVIKDTLKDIRSFVRFNQNKINSFALEFTDRYKIYTVYRSCNDNGTGAYVAIIVYVPHAIRIANIRQVLTKMMDKYFEEYVHPLYGTYIPGKYDDIKPFSAMLAAEAVVTPEQRRARVMPSTQDNTPNVRLYTDIAEVDEFFGSPYRPEFFACQEVMFLDKSIYDKIPDTLQFQMPPRIIERVSPPEPLPAIELGSYANDAKVFTVNGQPQNTAGKVEVNDFDKVELVFTKPYHEDFVLSGTVSELIAKRLLNERGKTISVAPFRFVPRRYTVKVNLNGQSAPDDILRVWFVKNSETSVVRSEIQLSGADVRTPLHWAVKAAPEGGWIEAKDIIYPYEAIDSDKPVELATVVWPFTVKAGDVRSGNLRVELGRGLKLSFPFTGNREGQISITVPKGEYSSKDFLFSADDALVREADGVVTIEPKPEEYTLEIPGVKRFWDNWDWDFKMDGASCRVGNDRIRFQSGQKMSSGKGRLTINGMEFEYKPKNDVVTPYAVVVRTNTMVAVDVNGETYDVSSIAIFPDRAMPRVIDTEKYEVDHNTAGPVQEMRVSLKGNSYNPGGDIGHDTPSKKKQIQVTFLNCKGFVIESNGTAITSDRETITMQRDVNWISNKKEKRCTIYKDGRKYASNSKVVQENQADGFTVRYDDFGCTVTYDGKSGSDLPKKWIVIGSVAAAVIALAVAAWLVLPWSDWFGKNTMAPIAKISFVPDSEVEGFSEKNAVIEKIAPATTLLAVKDDSIIQVMYDSRFLKKNCEDNINRYIDSVKAAVISLKMDGVQLPDYYLKDAAINSPLYEQMKACKTALEGKKNGPASISIYLAVNSPVRKAVDEFAREQANSPREILFSRAKDIMHDNPATAAPIMAICWERLEADPTAENIASFHEAFRAVEGFSNYESQMDVWSKEIREKAQVEQNRADLLKDANAQIVMLHKMTCSSTTVANVNNWWEKLTPEQKQTCRDARVRIDNYILAYNKFFNAKGVDDMKDLNDHYLSYFSAEQQKVITQEYGKDTKAFKKRQAAANGMKFSY